MGFFYKINYSMIVNTFKPFKQVCDRRHWNIFHESSASWNIPL